MNFVGHIFMIQQHVQMDTKLPVHYHINMDYLMVQMHRSM